MVSSQNLLAQVKCINIISLQVYGSSTVISQINSISQLNETDIQSCTLSLNNAFVNFGNCFLILHTLGIWNSEGCLVTISIVFCLRKIRRLKEDYTMNKRGLISQLLRIYILTVLCFLPVSDITWGSFFKFPKDGYLFLRENFNEKQKF
jgi:hypothetical protein